MGVISRLVKFGARSDHSFSQKLRIELLNIFVLLTTVATVLMLGNNLTSHPNPVVISLSIIWLILSALSFYLLHKDRLQEAKYLIIIGSVLFLGVLQVYYGSGLRSEAYYLGILLAICYLFHRKAAIWVILFTASVYAISNALNLFIEAPYQHLVVPGMRFAYLILAVMMTLALTNRVLRESYKNHMLNISQNEKLKQTNKELQKFNYLVTHDIKSPVNTIIQFSDLLIQGESISPERFKMLSGYVNSNARRIKDLIDDIVELSDLNNTKKEEIRDVDLERVFYNVHQTLEPYIEERNAIVNCEDLPHFNCSPIRISLLFQNLIQNGLKYNSSNQPKVTISSETNEDWIRLYFEDNGIGIREEDQAGIFQFFKRLHSKDQYEGTGIGLGLCNKIVQNYGGRMSVVSDEGKGSTFIVHLPRNPITSSSARSVRTSLSNSPLLTSMA